MRRSSLLLSAGVMLALFALPGIAQAAPSVISSEPARDAELHEAPDTVSITFDMPLDPNESDLVVVNECGRRIDGDDATVTGNRIEASIAEEPSGLYTMQYRATPPAGVTGTSSGEIQFTVHKGKSCGTPVMSGHQHGGHGGHENPGGGGGDGHGDTHEGHGDGNTDHQAGGDSSGHDTHSTSTTPGTSHTTHAAGAGEDHSSMDHGSRSNGGRGSQHAGEHQPRHGSDSHGSDRHDMAAPQVGGTRFTSVDGSSVLIALGLCLVMGLAGGWLIRRGGISL